MFKKTIIRLAFVAIIGVLVFGAVNRTLAKNEKAGNTNYHAGNVYSDTQSESFTDFVGNSYGQSNEAGVNNASTQINALTTSSVELSQDEVAALLYMRKEEKLARDVYLKLGAQWSLPIFQNISHSEQAHMDAVKVLLDWYGQTDPASSEIGIFTNPDLQALYNDLIARGIQSQIEALKVGAAIEEIDILDLQKHLAEADHANIEQVFNNLLNGSYNHLRAFVSTLNTQTGEAYQPQYLHEQTYQAIISTSVATGRNGNGGGNR
jgi:hypothetical protein